MYIYIYIYIYISLLSLSHLVILSLTNSEQLCVCLLHSRCFTEWEAPIWKA